MQIFSLDCAYYNLGFCAIDKPLRALTCCVVFNVIWLKEVGITLQIFTAPFHDDSHLSIAQLLPSHTYK